MKRRERTVLVVILSLVAALLRLGYVHDAVVENPLRADAGQYDRYGVNLVDQGVYSLAAEGEPARPDSLRSPGYPLLRALVYGVAPDHPASLQIVLYLQALLGALCVPLCYSLGRRLRLPAPYALGAAVLTLASPHLVALAGYHLSETLFSFLLLGALWCWVQALRRPTLTRLGAAGLLFSAATLTNETCLLLLPLLAVLAWRRGELTPRRLATVACAFAIPLAPWFARNAMVDQVPGLRSSTRAVATLSHGSYPGFVHEDPTHRYFPYRDDPEQPAYGSSLASFLPIFVDRVAERPLRYLSWYALEKPYWAWSWNILQGAGDVYVYDTPRSLFRDQLAAKAVHGGMRLLHPLLVLAALVGLASVAWPRLRTRRGDLPLLLTLGYFTALWTVFAPWPRYSVPVRPELYLVAMATVHCLWSSRRPRISAVEPEAGPDRSPGDRAEGEQAVTEGPVVEPVRPSVPLGVGE